MVKISSVKKNNTEKYFFYLHFTNRSITFILPLTPVNKPLLNFH
jgi:hypothetical protein